MRINGIEIKWLGHSGFLIEVKNSSSEKDKDSAPKVYTKEVREPAKAGPDKSSTKISTWGKIIYIDPYNINEREEKADLIFLTHSHYDHCSVADMKKIIKDGTKIIAPPDCQSKINHFDIPIRMELIEEGQELEVSNIKVIAVPSYNIDKPFHSKEEGGVGYILKIGEVIIYHAGDTDLIPEMQKLTGHKHNGNEFVALLPVGGRFTMGAEEACEAAKLIKPTLAIPMHYGSVVGTIDDAQEFKELCDESGINCEILEKEN